MQQFKVTYNIKAFVGTFTRIVEVADSDVSTIKKELNRLLVEDGVLLVDGSVPVVNEVLLVIQQGI